MFEEERRIFHELWSTSVNDTLYHKKHWGILSNYFEEAVNSGDAERVSFIIILATLYAKFAKDLAEQKT